MKNVCFSLLLSAVMLTACAPSSMRVVDTVDTEQFVAMSRALRPVMVKKSLVDKKGSWYSPWISSAPKNAGEVLLNRLSPAFRFPGASSLPATFRGMLTHDARVKLDGNRAVIEQGLNVTTLELVACTDWNSDGAEDWLARCTTRFTDAPGAWREYYLLITERDAPVLQAHLLALRDHKEGRVELLYDATAGELSDTPVIELLQGQAVITESPDKVSAERKGRADSGVKARSLQN